MPKDHTNPSENEDIYDNKGSTTAKMADLLMDEDEDLAGIAASPLESELKAAQQLAQENHDKYLRIQAEMQNAERRAQQNLSNAHKYAIENFAKDLIPVVDSLEQAIEMDENLPGKMREGLDLTLKLLVNNLEKYQLKQINPVGEAFNPHFHEAMAMQPDKSVENGTILKVYQKGYLLHDRLVRPARVVVVKND